MTSPFLMIYNFLNEDEELAVLMSNHREINEDGENMIFTFVIREDYQKQQYTPAIRLTPITQIDINWSDFDSQDYELHFSLEIFSKTITIGNEISTYIVDKLKNELNCIRTSHSLQYDEKLDVYNTFMRFKIIVEKGDI